MTLAEVLAALEMILNPNTDPAVKPIEEAALNQLRAALAGHPILLGLVNSAAAAFGL